MKIMVCGGAGYIGSHTVRQLRKEGHEVLVLDNLFNGHLRATGDAKFIYADIIAKNSLQQVFRNNHIEAVIHFAAYCLVGESMEQPYEYYRNNVAGTLNLLKTMCEAGVKYIIFSSTAAVYGEPLHVPITEEHPTLPTNPYGATKLAAEEMLKWFNRAYDLKYISLRYFNAAGADPAGDLGEDHTPETHLIPLILQTAMGLRKEVHIWGSDYPTPDGTCIRDYIHVTDLADAHILALKKLTDDDCSDIYNLGNGRGFSVREVIKTAERVTGKSINIVEKERRPGDPAILVASAEKARRELGWTPRYDRLETIISTAWNWHRKHPRGYKT